MLYELSFLMHV